MAGHDFKPSSFYAWLLPSARHALLPLLVAFFHEPDAPLPPTDPPHLATPTQANDHPGVWPSVIPAGVACPRAGVSRGKQHEADPTSDSRGAAAAPACSVINRRAAREQRWEPVLSNDFWLLSPSR